MFQLPVDWTFSDYICLESFCLPDFWCITDGLLIGLGRTSNLTELDIGSRYLKSWESVVFYEGALLHTQDAAEVASRLSNAISHLTGLTRLVTHFPVKASLIGRFTRLVSLGIYIEEKDTDNLEHSLAKLEHLEELELASFPHIRSSCLSKLPRLKSLSLISNNRLDDELVNTLVHLPQLTSLRVHDPREEQFTCINFSDSFFSNYYPDSFNSYFSNFSRLSNLRQLHIASRPDAFSDLCDIFPEGSFPRLRVLRIGLDDFSDDTRRRVMERFPCLVTLTSGHPSEEETL